MALPGEIAVRTHDGTLAVPMIPGAREPGIPAAFGQHSVVILLDGPSTMDAATIAMHQKEGGGGPAQRRLSRQQLPWNAWVRKLHHFLTGRSRT
jgi:hypothetical protein